MEGHARRLYRLLWPWARWIVLAIAAAASAYAAAVQFKWISPPLQARVVNAVQALPSWWPHILAVVVIFVAIRFYIRIVALERTVHDLVTPKAVIEIAPDFETLRGSTRLFRIHMRNVSALRLESCSLRLDECVAEDNTPLVIHFPAGLERDDGWGPCPLSPNSPKGSTFIQRDESDLENPIRLNCISSLKYGDYKEFPQHLDPRGIYRIRIGVHPQASQPHQRRFKVFVQDGRLRVEDSGG